MGNKFMGNNTVEGKKYCNNIIKKKKLFHKKLLGDCCVNFNLQKYSLRKNSLRNFF